MFKILLGLTLVGVIASTPLDDYVNQPDDHYKFELLKVYELSSYKLYILNLTSQKWLDETVVVNPIWWHFLCITIPNNLTRPDAGLLLIDGGDNDPNE
jgi:PhoPQ-activated pathogenicity-related protein